MLLVLNTGSSTLKYAWFENLQEVARETLEIEGPSDYAPALRSILDRRPGETIDAVGHRVVHGGDQYTALTPITAAVKTVLRDLCELAPLHNPPALAVIEAAQKALPNIPHLAAFDTAFFSTLPDYRFIYPIPFEWYEKWRVRRFGFHGISYSYIVSRYKELTGKSGHRVIACHLGNGCSATAIDHGKAVATTMGFTPQEGLMMGTRSGSVDPGLLLYLERQKEMSPESLEHAIGRQSGLLGVSGVSGDYRQVAQAAAHGHPRSLLAISIYADRISSAIGSLAVALGHVDALVFTGGVGEHATELREAVCRGLECLGLRLDVPKNQSARAEEDLSVEASSIRIYTIPTREELQIAREMNAFLKK